MKRISLLLMFVSGCVTPAVAEAQCVPTDEGFTDDGAWIGSATVLPIEITTAADGAPRFSVPVQVGDAPPIRALLDTGSAGLRILPGVVPDSSFAAITDERSSDSYHASLLSGRVAEARITLGDRTTRQPIPVLHIDSAGSRDAFDGFGAILGVGMRNSECSTIGNPIAQLPGHPSFIVRAPNFPESGGQTIGALEIGPITDEPFTFVHLERDPGRSVLADGTLPFDDHAVPTCVTDETHAASWCAGAVLDSGSASTEIAWTAYEGNSYRLPGGTELTVSLGALAQYQLTVGAEPQDGLDAVEVESTTALESRINLGSAIFFRYDVWFDQPHGVIGLLPHA